MSIQERGGCMGIVARTVHSVIELPRKVAQESGTSYYFQLLNNADKLDGEGSHGLATTYRTRAELHRTQMIDDGLIDPIQHSLAKVQVKQGKNKLKRRIES